jgi:hypothetical protein
MKIEPFPGKLEKQLVKCKRSAAWKIVLTDEQRAWLIRWFPEEENPRLLKLSGMSHSTLHRYARELHLTKSAEGMKRIKKQHTRKLKRTCERNGYYDSLRGKPVSEATRQGTKRMWQEVRDGKREHPARIMKRHNPRKYRKWMQRKSEERKETIRKETRRVLYGLQRQTRLKCIVMCKYTKRQTSHRYNALKRGYIIMEDCSEQGGGSQDTGGGLEP